MKSLIAIIFMAGFSFAVVAQDVPQSEVPAEVVNAFQSKFSKATDVDWEMEGDLYKVDFEIGSRDHDLWIDKSGNIRKHREELSKGDLPQAITQKIKSEFKEYRIDDADKVEADGKTLYLVDLDGREEDREVWFTADGTIQEGLE